MEIVAVAFMMAMSGCGLLNDVIMLSELRETTDS